jgi:hypothetical protein
MAYTSVSTSPSIALVLLTDEALCLLRQSELANLSLRCELLDVDGLWVRKGDLSGIRAAARPERNYRPWV